MTGLERKIKEEERETWIQQKHKGQTQEKTQRTLIFLTTA
jgi:hypothetical protein